MSTYIRVLGTVPVALWRTLWAHQVESSAVPAGFSVVPPAGMRDWLDFGSTGLPQLACHLG